MTGVVLGAVCGHREAMRDPFAAHCASKAWWYARGQLPCMAELMAAQQVLRNRYFPSRLEYSRSLMRDLRMSFFGMREWLGECTERGWDDHDMELEIARLQNAEERVRLERQHNAMEDAWYNQH